MVRPRVSNPDLDLYQSGTLVRLVGVNTGYGASTVLFGVDFEARVGEVALVTGPAAAGKTTLTHLLRLALPPRSGRTVILGVDVARAGPDVRAEVKRRIGYIAEDPVFVEHWSAFDNIAMPLRMGGRRARDYHDDVRELVDFVGIGEAADLPVQQLSGAERRRTAIARALASKPQLILADDPTANMSPADGRRVARLLAEMRRVGAGVVICSQDESLAECAQMRRWRIDHGRVTQVDEAAPQAEAEVE
ncbi:MAG: ATP-binding cassette domain-containing protein [Hyphomonadaceae bacterium]|nr:ATP-binding cassette domain-containing protein [Hyphomonadaceae bacterium]